MLILVSLRFCGKLVLPAPYFLPEAPFGLSLPPSWAFRQEMRAGQRPFAKWTGAAVASVPAPGSLAPFGKALVDVDKVKRFHGQDGRSI